MVSADDPDILATHNWDDGSTNAAGKFVYTCEDCGEVTLPKKFSGKATITITATDASKIYGKATKKVTVTVPKAPTLKTVKSSKSKQLTVKWSKVKGATGYQLYYKVGSKAKTVKITKASTVKKVIKKLKKGKTYKVYVRSYIKDGKTLYYSNWSKVKKAKTK